MWHIYKVEFYSDIRKIYIIRFASNQVDQKKYFISNTTQSAIKISILFLYAIPRYNFMLIYIAMNVFLDHVTRKRTMKEEKNNFQEWKGSQTISVMYIDKGRLRMVEGDKQSREYEDTGSKKNSKKKIAEKGSLIKTRNKK